MHLSFFISIIFSKCLQPLYIDMFMAGLCSKFKGIVHMKPIHLLKLCQISNPSFAPSLNYFHKVVWKCARYFCGAVKKKKIVFVFFDNSGSDYYTTSYTDTKNMHHKIQHFDYIRHNINIELLIFFYNWCECMLYKGQKLLVSNQLNDKAQVITSITVHICFSFRWQTLLYGLRGQALAWP